MSLKSCRKKVTGTTGCMMVNLVSDEHLPKKVLSPIAAGSLLKPPAGMENTLKLVKRTLTSHHKHLYIHYHLALKMQPSSSIINM